MDVPLIIPLNRDWKGRSLRPLVMSFFLLFSPPHLLYTEKKALLPFALFHQSAGLIDSFC